MLLHDLAVEIRDDLPPAPPLKRLRLDLKNGQPIHSETQTNSGLDHFPRDPNYLAVQILPVHAYHIRRIHDIDMQFLQFYTSYITVSNSVPQFHTHSLRTFCIICDRC